MMHIRHALWAGAATAALMALFVACASNEEPTPPAASIGGSAGTGGTAGGAGTANGGSAGTAGTGGAAGAAGTAGSGTGGTGGAAGTGGAGGSGTAGDHVLISEVCMLSNPAEFIELYNPTSQEIDLSDYYLSDNSVYYTITSGMWNPTQTAGTDFVVRFPSGTKIAAGAVITIGANPTGYETNYGSCPTFFLNTASAPVACGGGSVPAMLIPANGTLGDQFGQLLSNNREMVILFTWDGTSSTVKDVDYVTWGDTFEDATRVDKTGVAGYQADTARASQKGAGTGFVPDAGAPDGGGDLAIQRCAIETGEKFTGGNGLTGHDETTEDFTTTFKSTQTPSPGVKNSCLP